MEDKLFKRLIVRTHKAKQTLKEAKDMEATYSSQLKKELNARGFEKGNFEDIGYKVSYTTSVRSSINEDKLLEVVNNLIGEAERASSPYLNELQGCIIKKPVIDENKVHELINKGILNIEDIQEAYEEKEYKTLRIKEIK